MQGWQHIKLWNHIAWHNSTSVVGVEENEWKEKKHSAKSIKHSAPHLSDTFLSAWMAFQFRFMIRRGSCFLNPEYPYGFWRRNCLMLRFYDAWEQSMHCQSMCAKHLSLFLFLDCSVSLLFMASLLYERLSHWIFFFIPFKSSYKTGMTLKISSRFHSKTSTQLFPMNKWSLACCCFCHCSRKYIHVAQCEWSWDPS